MPTNLTSFHLQHALSINKTSFLVFPGHCYSITQPILTVMGQGQPMSSAKYTNGLTTMSYSFSKVSYKCLMMNKVITSLEFFSLANDPWTGSCPREQQGLCLFIRALHSHECFPSTATISQEIVSCLLLSLLRDHPSPLCPICSRFML